MRISSIQKTVKKTAKPSTDSTRTYKNPLAQVLGIVLQKMRNAMVLSSDEVALRLGLGGSSYRMIEAGSAILQPGKSIRVIQTFERIEFAPLCKCLVALQVTEAGSGTAEDMRLACRLLGEVDPLLQDVVEKLNPIWSILETADPGEVSEKIRALKIDIALETFLTTPSPTVQDHQGVLKAHVNSLLNSTPPFYFDLAVDMLENLQGYIPRVSPVELAKWEEKNKSRITDVVGAIRDSRSWTNPENFDLFAYGFLWESQFEQLRLMVLSGAKKDVAADFRSHLKTSIERRSRKSDPRLTGFGDALKKINVRSGIRHASTENLFLCDGVMMNNIWFYKLRGGQVVAFADNYEVDARENALYYGTSFAYGETIKKLNLIESIWDDTGA